MGRQIQKFKTYRSVTVRFCKAMEFDVKFERKVSKNHRNDVQAKSMVSPYGVPSSSLRAYRFPIEVLESSTREKTPALRNLEAAGRNGDARRVH